MERKRGDDVAEPGTAKNRFAGRPEAKTTPNATLTNELATTESILASLRKRPVLEAPGIPDVVDARDTKPVEARDPSQTWHDGTVEERAKKNHAGEIAIETREKLQQTGQIMLHLSPTEQGLLEALKMRLNREDYETVFKEALDALADKLQEEQ